MKRQAHAALIAILFAGFFITTLVGSTSANVKPAVSAVPTKVLVFTQPENIAFKERIQLDSRLQLTYEYNGSVAQINNLNNFQVFLVCGYLPDDPTYIQYLTDNITAGKSLFMFGGYYPILTQISVSQYNNFKALLPVVFKEPFTIEEELYLNQGWVGQIELKVNSDFLWDENQSLDQDILQRSVVWESSPLVKERIFVKDAKADAKVLVYRPEQGRVSTTFDKGEPLVAYRTQGSGKILWVSMAVGSTTANFADYVTQGVGPYWQRVKVPGSEKPRTIEANKPFYLWPYFNFFLFQSVRFLGGLNSTEIDTYAQWPFSPIPHEAEATLWMIFVAGLWVFNFVLFFTLGKKKKTTRPDATTPEQQAAPGAEKELTADERKAMEAPKSNDKEDDQK
ncbi:MAG: hypothetical protein GYA24_13000 [Candidatus Lokiarchaeota archaeon]|nr:hypothetical protein [Candidatus Lokiarchaeota archaeon]